MIVLKMCLPILGLCLLVSGCATTRTSALGKLQMRVGELERQVKLKEEQLKDLSYEVKELSYELERFKEEGRTGHRITVESGMGKAGAISLSMSEQEIIRVPISVETLQKALKNAGYYTGVVDNKLGKMTKSAISRFQTDHGLQADGIVGKKTWNELKVYVEQ